MSSLIQLQLFEIDSTLKLNGQINDFMVEEESQKDRYFQIGLQSIANIMNPQFKIECQSCSRDIITSEADYCPGCFAKLQEYPSEYHVINKLDFALFDYQWSAQEELYLIEGLIKYGFGNWLEIADFIGTNKTKEDVQKHYMTTYINSQEQITRRDQSNYIQNYSNHSQRKFQEFSNRQNATETPLKHNLTRKTGGLTLNQNTPEIMGYMPKRGDFDVQYDNEAELLLADLQFEETDTSEERIMKFKLIDIYNHRLTQRIKRKQFVISRSLLNLKEQIQLEKSKNQQKRQAANLMKVFARFNTAQNHQKLIQAIIKQKEIRQIIAELNKYKDKGYKTLAQVESVLEQRFQKQEKSLQKNQQSSKNKRKNCKQKNSSSRMKKVSEGQVSQQKDQLVGRLGEDLCRKLKLTLSQYIAIKKEIVRASASSGRLSKKETSKKFGLDPSVISQILEHVVKTEGIAIVTSTK